MASKSNTYDPDGDLVLILTAPEEKESTSPNTANTEAPKDKPSKEIRVLVSSKAMTLVSPVFKAMLRHQTFKEGHDLAKGTAEIPLPDDDATTFKIILHIIHHNVSQVPRKLDLIAATNMAILVDKYQIHDVMILYSEIWVKELRTSSPLPSSLSATLPRWLCISWVFDLYDDFNLLTKIAQIESKGCLQTVHFAPWDLPDLPIPSRVFGISPRPSILGKRSLHYYRNN